MTVIDLSDGPAARTAGPTFEPGSIEDRILSATRSCVERWGMAKTTLDDIAREAGCSRATVYRIFPGGKDVVFGATVEREIRAGLRSVAEAARSAGTFDELLGLVLWTGVRLIREHAALQYLCAHEPGVIMPWTAFDGLDPVLAVITDVLAPSAERFVAPPVAREAAEALCRLVISFAFEHDHGPLEVFSRTDAQLLVDTFLVPGLRPGAHPTTAETIHTAVPAAPTP